MDLSATVRSLILLTIFAAMAAAHDIEASTQFAAPAVVVRATYAGSQPVPFAKVQVFAPGSDGAEFQTGMTDRRGYFGFVPEGAGVWRVILDDGEGHRKEVSVTVPERFGAGTEGGSGAPVPRLARALVGIALLLGATGVWYGIKARKTS